MVIPLVFDLSAYADLPGPEIARQRLAALREAGDRPVVLFLSRLHVKKGVEHLIDAVALLARGGTPPMLVIAGSGDAVYESSLRARAADRGVGAHVRFAGFVSGVEKVSLLRAASVFVLPSSQENFGYAIFEALAAGTPVVASRLIDTWPEVESSGGGVIVDQSASAIAAAIRPLLADPARRATMGARGREWVLRAFDEPALVARYEALYAEARRPA